MSVRAKYLDGLSSPEHVQWKRHRDLLLERVGFDESGWRGCIGLGLVVQKVEECIETGTVATAGFFIPDHSLRWLSLVDIPRGYFKLDGGRRREVSWATLRATRVVFGMPTFTGPAEAAWDFRALPHDPYLGERGTLVRVPEDVLSPSRHQVLFRALNRINWSMTCAATALRDTWQGCQLALPEELANQVLAVVNNRLTVASPASWLPVPYVGFPESIVSLLFERCTRPLGGNNRVYPRGLRLGFCDFLAADAEVQAPCSGKLLRVENSTYHGMPAVTLLLEEAAGGVHKLVVRRGSTLFIARGKTVKRGERLAREPICLPPSWGRFSVSEKWDYVLPRLLRHDFEPWLQLWFERSQLRLVPGQVHLPSSSCCMAAYANAVPGSLYWDVNPGMPHYQEDCDTFIFPPLRTRRWNEFLGTLPGEIFYDFTPSDPRYVPVDKPVRRRKTHHTPTSA